MTSTAGPVPRLLEVTSEEHLFALLSALNNSGMTAELPCVQVFNVGTTERPNVGTNAFLATLTDPDADYVNYIYSDESGHSVCPLACPDCGSTEPLVWEPTYPVTALLGQEPDLARAIEDEIDTWWALTVPTGAATLNLPRTPNEYSTSGLGGTVHVKVACNGCGRLLGDPLPGELEALVAGEGMPDLRPECGCTP